MRKTIKIYSAQLKTFHKYYFKLINKKCEKIANKMLNIYDPGYSRYLKTFATLSLSFNICWIIHTVCQLKSTPLFYLWEIVSTRIDLGSIRTIINCLIRVIISNEITIFI